jgi:D-ribulokinase
VTLDTKMTRLSLGIDFGTSGARAIAIDNDRNIRWTSQLPHSLPDPHQWAVTLEKLLAQIPTATKGQIDRIAIDGTSGTVLLCDDRGQSLGPALMYNDDRGGAMIDRLRQLAPPGHGTISATSSLAKLLWYADRPYFGSARHLLHQADWLAALLHGDWGLSDYHNALKLGYDPQVLAYPDWLATSDYKDLLPEVRTPGSPIGPLLPQWTGFATDCLVCAGTTDSIGAFAAAGATTSGEAVTSLGSTLVLKLLCDRPINDSASGVYSHRWGDLWLAGGASNSGGAVLRHFFSDAELRELSDRIDPDRPSALRYYPLLKAGERFPINDPYLPPQLDPRPAADTDFLQGLLEGMARIEKQGFDRLQQLGANPVTKVYSAGGGARNLTWQKIRQRHLGVPVIPAAQGEAAYGTALLARWGIYSSP